MTQVKTSSPGSRRTIVVIASLVVFVFFDIGVNVLLFQKLKEQSSLLDQNAQEILALKTQIQRMTIIPPHDQVNSGTNIEMKKGNSIIKSFDCFDNVNHMSLRGIGKGQNGSFRNINNLQCKFDVSFPSKDEVQNLKIELLVGQKEPLNRIFSELLNRPLDLSRDIQKTIDIPIEMKNLRLSKPLDDGSGIDVYPVTINIIVSGIDKANNAIVSEDDGIEADLSFYE